MRLSINPVITRVGNVEIGELCRVTELDAGFLAAMDENTRFSYQAIHKIESQMAITIPCMNEDLDALDGVLHGVPHDCLIILVSNSTTKNYEAERQLLTNYCETARRKGITVHQQDTGLACAFHGAGLPEIVEPTGLGKSADKLGTIRIRNGKGEAMMIGVAISKYFRKDFIGFIDADNYAAGSVHEYCKVYASSIHHALSEPTGLEPPQVMVRIKWNSKPKARGDKIIFEKSGRSSVLVNQWMNHLLTDLKSGETYTDFIQTGNAGEHAMSLELALKLRFATGYAVEPFQIVNALEQFGLRNSDASPPESPPSSPAEAVACSMTYENVKILQILTRNPHFHDASKGEDHIARMQVQGLSTIYHSHLISKDLQDKLRIYMKVQFPGYVDPNGAPPQTRDYPPLATMDVNKFGELALEKAKTLVCIGL